MKAKVTPISTVLVKDYNAKDEKKQNVIGQKIKNARKESGLTLAEMCTRLKGCGIEVSKGAASKWETGETVPNAYQLVAVLNTLGMEDRLTFFMENYVPILNEEGVRKVTEYRSDLVASGKYRPVRKAANNIKYIDMRISNLCVSAGTGTFLDEGNFETISFPKDKVPENADFGVRVSGDSMEPVYHDGQIVWVQECEEISAGQVGVFIYDGEGFLKIYNEQEPEASEAEEFTDSYGNVRLQPVMESYNPAYEPRIVHPSARFEIVGRAL